MEVWSTEASLVAAVLEFVGFSSFCPSSAIRKITLRTPLYYPFLPSKRFERFSLVMKQMDPILSLFK